MSVRSTFTSESVTEGHPDKMADQISDAILDALLEEDPNSRVACEALLTTGLVVVAGEITTKTYVDIQSIVRSTICDIGYDNDAVGFNGRTCGVVVTIGEQSPDIAQGVGAAYEFRTGAGGEDVLNAQGAGDQGMMFGFACDETPDLMPLPIWLAHRFAQRLAQVRRVGVLPYICPDGKTQVSVVYEDGRPIALDTVVISTQHRPGIDLETLLLPDLKEHVIHPLLPSTLDTDNVRVFATPQGSSSGEVPARTPGSPAGRSSWTPTGAWHATGVVRSRGRTPPRSTVRRPTRRAGSPSTSSPPVRRAGARSRGRTRSGWRDRSRCSWRPSAPRRSTRPRSPRPFGSSSTSARRRSSATWTFVVPSTGGPPPTVTSVVRTKSSPGRRPPASTSCGPRSVCDLLALSVSGSRRRRADSKGTDSKGPATRPLAWGTR